MNDGLSNNFMHRMFYFERHCISKERLDCIYNCTVKKIKVSKQGAKRLVSPLHLSSQEAEKIDFYLEVRSLVFCYRKFP